MSLTAEEAAEECSLHDSCNWHGRARRSLWRNSLVQILHAFFYSRVKRAVRSRATNSDEDPRRRAKSLESFATEMAGSQTESGQLPSPHLSLSPFRFAISSNVSLHLSSFFVSFPFSLSLCLSISTFLSLSLDESHQRTRDCVPQRRKLCQTLRAVPTEISPYEPLRAFLRAYPALQRCDGSTCARYCQ